jgi:cytochrome c
MNKKVLLTALFVLAGVLGAIVPASAQQSPPESERARQIVALVETAAALIDSKGRSIFPEFRKAGSEWLTGDAYVFVGDLLI